MPATYRLVPTADEHKRLEADYMSAIIFETPPTSDEVLSSIQELEKRLNDGSAAKAELTSVFRHRL